MLLIQIFFLLEFFFFFLLIEYIYSCIHVSIRLLVYITDSALQIISLQGFFFFFFGYLQATPRICLPGFGQFFFLGFNVNCVYSIVILFIFLFFFYGTSFFTWLKITLPIYFSKCPKEVLVNGRTQLQLFCQKKKKSGLLWFGQVPFFFWACRGNGHVEWLCKSLALYSSLAESSVLLIDTFFVFTRYAGSPSLLACNVMDKIHPCRLFRPLIGAIFLMSSGSFCDPRSNFLFFLIHYWLILLQGSSWCGVWMYWRCDL